MRSFIIAAALLLVGVAFSSASTTTSPVFLWSNTQYFTGKNLQVKTLTPAENFFQTLSRRDSLKPETIVIFVQPHLKTDEFVALAGSRSSSPNGGAFNHLKTLIETSTSSVVVPYVLPNSEGAIGSELVEEIKSFKDGIVTIVSENADVEGYAGVEQIKLSDISTISPLDNGKTNLIVVYMTATSAADFSRDDARVQEICNRLSSKSYVAVFTAKNTVTQVQKRSFDLQDARPLTKRLEQYSYYSSANVWNSSIVTALVVAVPLLLILFVGLSCGFDIQSEINFEKPLGAKKNL